MKAGKAGSALKVNKPRLSFAQKEAKRQRKVGKAKAKEEKKARKAAEKK